MTSSSTVQPLHASAAPVRVVFGSLEALLSLAVFVLAVLAFAGAAGGPFVLDDGPLIANNSMLHELGNFPRFWQSDFWSVDNAQAQLGERLRYYRPLVLTSYALDWRLGGGDPLVFHVTNLILHGFISVLAFVTLRRWTSRSTPAFVAALVFALHPAHAENVAWISGRPDLLVGLGVLLAALGMAQAGGSGGTRVPGWVLEGLGTLLAYSSKELAVVLPAFSMIEAWVALGRPQLSRGTLLVMLRRSSGQIAVMAAYLVARATILPLREFDVEGLAAGRHLAFVLETLGRLHQLFFFPDDLSMSRSMLRTGPDGPMPSEWHVWLGGGLLLLSVSLAWACRRKPSLLLSLALWWGLCLPVSNLVWTGMANLTSPRFLYLPSLGLAWFLAELGSRVRWRGARALVSVASLAACLALLSCSVVRSRDFRSVTAFWNVELSKHPEAVLPHAFAVTYERDRRRPRRALALAARGFVVTARDFSHDAQRSELILAALELLASVTPDAQVVTLAEIDAFVLALVEGRPARLRWDGGLLAIEPESRVRRDLLRLRPRLDLLRAEIASRRGDDGHAVELARSSVASCARCSALWESAALIALRARERRLAEQWLAGPSGRPFDEAPVHLRVMAERVWQLEEEIDTARGARRVQLEAQRLFTLGLSGRAYATLRPHREAILAAGGEAARTYAFAAWQAGEDAEARRALARHGLAPDRVEDEVARWARESGRTDAAIGLDEREYAATVSALLESSFRNRRQAAR